MPTETELYENIIKAAGGTVDDLPDRLKTTYLQRIAECITALKENAGGGGKIYRHRWETVLSNNGDDGTRYSILGVSYSSSKDSLAGKNIFDFDLRHIIDDNNMAYSAKRHVVEGGFCPFSEGGIMCRDSSSGWYFMTGASVIGNSGCEEVYDDISGVISYDIVSEV